jgi:hypothetical protein
MKRLILFFSLCIFASLTSFGQEEILKNVSSAMKAGSAKELVKYFHSVVEINIDGERSNYSQTQAEVVIRDFFQKKPSTGFEYIHEGASKEGLSYTIGKYSYKDGSYRVVMFIKKFGDRFAVDTFNLSKE